MQLRNYLHRSLYDPTEGYFTASKSTIPVGSIGKPLEFNKLLGQADYLSAVKEHYNHLQASWLTPSEIFTPYYGCAIANFILDKHSQMAEPGTPLRIFEIGGGTGTLARDILDHLRASVPDVYREVDYRMVEISPVLAQLQERTVADVGGHSDHFQVECRDAADLRGWDGSKGDDPCFLLLMEVMDNCPHDRVHRESPSQPWLQTAIREHKGSDSPPSASAVEETLQPLSDDLIQQCLAVGPWEHNGKPFWHRLLDWAVDAGSHGAENTIFLPTGCMVLLDTLIKARPFHCVLAADFDHLPETRIPGKNAPLVATTAGGKTIDHSTYLVDAGSADIFFPTDFYMLERMYGVLSKRDSASEGITTSVLKNEAFMKRYASIAETTTVQGYNPLLQDYSNTSFFIGQRT
ncbi:g9684 [Coccomyxa elongata]